MKRMSVRWRRVRDSNPRPPDRQSGALPAELTRHVRIEGQLGSMVRVCRWSGWPDSNRRPRRPERRALPAAPQPVVGVCVEVPTGQQTPSSGGRTRSPISWFRARCAAHCTTPEWGVRTLDPHAAHRRCRASPEIRTPIRGVRARSVSRYRRDAGVRAERVELSMDSVHRGLSPARLPVPPRPHGAPRRATSARWTQTGSNRHLTPCRGVALPLVLWARRPRSRSRTCRARRRLGYGQVPSRDGVPRLDRWNPAPGHGAAPIRLLAISSVFKDLFRRDRWSPYRNTGASHQQGCRESNPAHDGVGDRPATGASPLRYRCSCVGA
jgi:hypothetical protein